MPAPQIAFVVYFLFGYALMLYVCRRINGKLSIMDLLACAAAGLLWPLILLIFAIAALMFQPSWLTQKRW